ncbi:MAG: glycosyltransferase [Bacilli bacterium]|nr:glycosyltransferase [Bacilli bacterium]
MKQKKILFVANTDMHIELCYLPYIAYLKKQGYIVHVATNTNKIWPNCDKKISIPIHRTPFKLDNIKAITKLKKVIREEQYDFISTSTPMGAVITRFAAKKMKKKNLVKILYTAHGFHFFKGAPIINYILYYPIEKYLSKYTDILVTINNEDYQFSKKHFKIDTRLINGIGYHQDRFNNTLNINQKKTVRKQLGINNKDYVIIYIAEISKRKRQEYLVKALSKMNLDNIKVLLVGGDILNKKIDNMIEKLNLNNSIKILGFRSDVSKLLDISDLVLSVSRQEGLPLNIMEAMAKQKTIVVTDCRGNRDLIKNNYNGIIVPINDDKYLINTIEELKSNKALSNKLGTNNKGLVDKYEINNILPEYTKIYEELLNEENNN